MTKITRRRVLGAAGVLAASAALAACGTSSNDNKSGSSSGGVTSGPGVDVAKKTITVTNIGAQTGPIAALGIPANRAAKVFFKSLNAAGGIKGWKVNFKTVDGAYDPTKQVQEYSAVSGKSAVLLSVGSPTTKAIQKRIDADKVVTLPLSWDSAWSKDPVLAPVGTPYAVDIANAVDYFANHGAKSAKFGILYQNDEYGADAKRGYDAVVKADGLNSAVQTSYKLGDTDFTAQVQKLKAAGAKYVVLNAVPSATGPIVGTAATLGYAPTWILQGPAYIELLMTKDGTLAADPTPINAALAKSTYVASFAAAWGDTSVPGMDKMLADHDKYSPKQAPTVYFTYGYAQAMLVSKILAAAIDSGDLSRAGILKAKQGLGKVSLGGLVPDVTYSPTAATQSRTTLLNKIDASVDGFLKPVSDTVTSKAGAGL